ncbi:MAG: GIY-YIG nuclease family protein [Patescibacteria group bacterium]|nr:GIY-YIG nuclease family protein [Patescibacteria group bacterium]MBU2508831.1 GIY-YIG nuclease family protein [Patescibacteria group bacterium]
MATVYILKDLNDKIYVGSTTNIERRISEHERGHTATTRRLNDPKIAWKQDFPTLEQARKIERKIKKWKSRKMIELLINGTISI